MGVPFAARVFATMATVLVITGCSPPASETTEEFERRQVPKDQKMAEAGNAEAQYRMGLYSIAGTQMPRNIEQGILWLRKAADQNHLEAEHELGVAFLDGKTVPQAMLRESVGLPN